MGYWDNPPPKKQQENSEFDYLYEMEMCDICGKSFHCTQIRRIPYINSAGVLYKIRCCINCDPQTLTQQL